MKERDITKKLDSLVIKVREAATDAKDLFISMGYSTNTWSAHGLSRLYITVTVSDFCGANRRHYAAGYIDLKTGKYSSKVSPREKYPSISLARPTEKQIDMIVEGLGRAPKRAKPDAEKLMSDLKELNPQLPPGSERMKFWLSDLQRLASTEPEKKGESA